MIRDDKDRRLHTPTQTQQQHHITYGMDGHDMTYLTYEI